MYYLVTTDNTRTIPSATIHYLSECVHDTASFRDKNGIDGKIINDDELREIYENIALCVKYEEECESWRYNYKHLSAFERKMRAYKDEKARKKIASHIKYLRKVIGKIEKRNGWIVPCEGEDETTWRTTDKHPLGAWEFPVYDGE